MGFDAAATTPLEFTFRPHLDLTGTVPDPNESEVRAFNARVDRMRIDARVASNALDETDEDLVEKAEAIAERLHEQTLDAVAELCKGTPTREQIAALPHRVRAAFFEWLVEELRNPTKRPATGPPLVAVR